MSSTLFDGTLAPPATVPAAPRRSAERAGAATGGTLPPAAPPALELQGIDLSFGGVHALRGIDLRVSPGEPAGHHRAQRRGQEFAGQHHLRPVPARRRPRTHRQRVVRAGAHTPAGAPGRGAHLPEPGAVQGPLRARQHRPGPRACGPGQLCRAGAGLGPGAPRVARCARTGARSHRLPGAGQRAGPAGRRPLLRPAKAGGAWRARWWHAHASCCWTNPWPAPARARRARWPR